jgi:ABC-type glycerol-3-phosphate transport system permease component
VDGASEIQVLRLISTPIIAPGVIVTTVFVFIMSWNEFLFALVIGRNTARTVQVGLTTAQSNQGILWEQMAAAGMVVLLPVFVLSFLIRRNFTKGLTLGAVK